MFWSEVLIITFPTNDIHFVFPVCAEIVVNVFLQFKEPGRAQRRPASATILILHQIVRNFRCDFLRPSHVFTTLNHLGNFLFIII